MHPSGTRTRRPASTAPVAGACAATCRPITTTARLIPATTAPVATPASTIEPSAAATTGPAAAATTETDRRGRCRFRRLPAAAGAATRAAIASTACSDSAGAARGIEDSADASRKFHHVDVGWRGGKTRRIAAIAAVSPGTVRKTTASQRNSNPAAATTTATKIDYLCRQGERAKSATPSRGVIADYPHTIEHQRAVVADARAPG